MAFLDHAEGLKNTFTTLISFFFFLGYLLNSTLGGKWINTVGYKKTLLRAMSVMVGGLLMYFLSSWFAVIMRIWLFGLHPTPFLTDSLYSCWALI